jgi:hypothetical protein
MEFFYCITAKSPSQPPQTHQLSPSKSSYLASTGVPKTSFPEPLARTTFGRSWALHEGSYM